jgi:hypothetical protein
MLAALSLLVISAPASQAAEVTTPKNLSTPVILVDEDTMSAGFNPLTVPGTPTGTADYTKDAVNYYTGVGSDTYTSTIDSDGFTADQWGASFVTETTNAVASDVKWGDNLLSHVFPGNRKQPIRVEVNLFANATTTAAYPGMQGYTTVSLEGEGSSELFGTLGVAEALTPMVFTPKATLTILQYENSTDWYSKVILPPTTMAGEVNASGKVIYGFNWGTPSGLTQPGPGNYRLIFTVADDSLVTLDKALAGSDTEEEGTVNTAYVFGDKVSYLDMPIGSTPLVPALPYTAPIVKSDFNGDGRSDVIARDTAGYLWLYPGNGTGGFLARIRVGTAWNSMTTIVAPGDFNGDSHPDLLARDTAGYLWLYPGNGTGGWLARVRVGTAWNSMNIIVAPGDFNGDSHPDLLARDTAGYLWLYPGNGTGGWLARVRVGTAWNSMNAIVGVGDFTSDAQVDVMARDAAGYLWLYPGNGTGGWLARVRVGTGWGAMTAFAGPGDFSGDRYSDLMARDSEGQLLLYRGTGSAGWILPPWLIGSGWNAMTAIVA